MQYPKFTSAAVLLLTATAQHVHAFFDTFTVNCEPLTLQRSDPLVSPGIASGHVHAVVGGNAFSRNMSTPTAATIANSTTCDKYIDHSNYWVPNLYHHRTDGMYDMVDWTGSVSGNSCLCSALLVLNDDLKGNLLSEQGVQLYHYFSVLQ